jgi:hypothetical protein
MPLSSPDSPGDSPLGENSSGLPRGASCTPAHDQRDAIPAPGGDLRTWSPLPYPTVPAIVDEPTRADLTIVNLMYVTFGPAAAAILRRRFEALRRRQAFIGGRP